MKILSHIFAARRVLMDDSLTQMRLLSLDKETLKVYVQDNPLKSLFLTSFPSKKIDILIIRRFWMDSE